MDIRNTGSGKALGLKKILFLAYVFLLPLDGIHFLNFYVGFFHVTILDLLLVSMFYLVFLEDAVKGFEATPFIQKICLLLVFSAVLSSISLAYIVTDYLSYDIKRTFNILEFAVLIFVASQIIEDEVFLRRVLVVLCISIFIVSIASILKSLGMNIPGEVRGEARYFGPFFIGVTGLTSNGESFFAHVLGAFPFVLSGTIFKSRILRFVIALTVLLASVISYSRGLWVALCVEVVIFMSLFQMLHRSPIKRALISIVLVGSVLMLLFYWQSIYFALVELRPETVDTRLEGYLSGLEMATSSLTHFLLGFGEGAFFATLRGTPHNFLLEVLISKGVLVLLLFCFIIYMITSRLIAFTRKGLEVNVSAKSPLPILFVMQLAGQFVNGMFSPTFNSMIFWTMVALACACISISSDEVAPTSSYEGFVYKFKKV